MEVPPDASPPFFLRARRAQAFGVGVVFHSGDFKVDYTPVDGEPIDFSRLAEIGKKGVTLMLCDSTNALRPGFTASERVVGQTIENIFRTAKTRIIIATFSSNVHRVQRIIENAVKFGRKVAIYQAYQYGDRAGKMGLLKYSTGSFLDNLAALKGVRRNEPSAAEATVRFTLSAVLSKTAEIPKGTRVKGIDLYFETIDPAEILAGNLYVDVAVKCQTAGSIGNGFLPGDIQTLVDPLPYILSIRNITQSSGRLQFFHQQLLVYIHIITKLVQRMIAVTKFHIHHAEKHHRVIR